MSERTRVILPLHLLTPVIRVWFMHAPKWVWGKDPDFERLKKSKQWYDPSAERDPQRIAAEIIVSEMDRLGWRMCQPNLGASDELLKGKREECSEPCASEGDSEAVPRFGVFTAHGRRRR